MRLLSALPAFFLLFMCGSAFAQDVEFQLQRKLLAGKKIEKVKRNFNDPYVWLLTGGNEIYRVNSLDFSVSDYTTYFAAYTHLDFIDIAGVSQDQVFIATPSLVLHLNNNVLKEIGPAQGLVDQVTSIGIDFSRVLYGESNTGFLWIGSTLNRYFFDVPSETLTVTAMAESSVVHCSTFNKFMAETEKPGTSNPGISLVPNFFRAVTGTFSQFAWRDILTFGQPVRTMYYTLSDIGAATLYPTGGSAAIGSESNIFWGTDKGMFQLNRNNTNSTIWPVKTHLANIPVRKISSIYGLSSIGARWDSYLPLVRENILVGTSNGLYYGTNSYRNFSTGGFVDFSLHHYSPTGGIGINDISINTASKDPICENGVWLGADDGLYYLTPLYKNLPANGSFKGAYFKGMPGTETLALCSGASVTAVTDPNPNGTAVQWYKDGNPLNGATGSELTITAPGTYYAQFANTCSGVLLETNILTVTFSAVPAVILSEPDNLVICPGSSYTLQVPGQPGYTYRWLRNNSILPGQNSNQLLVTGEGSYRAEASTCGSTFYPSKNVNIAVENLAPPVIQATKTVYCTGESASLSIDAAGYSTFKWYRNGTELPQYANNSSLTTTNSGQYQVVSITPTGCILTSPLFTLDFNTPPAFAITSTMGNTLCHGSQTELACTTTSGSYVWSTGETTRSIRVNAPGRYSLTVTSDSGCSNTQQIDISILPELTLPTPSDERICTVAGESVTLQAPPGYTRYTWNGVPGQQFLTTSVPGNYLLAVEDANGCTAQASYRVLAYCKEVVIPSSFSPNGDGINDRWNIGGLETDETAKLSVFNRYGQLVYQATGCCPSWDGMFNGKALATGSYFYVLHTRQSALPLKGSITIFR